MNGSFTRTEKESRGVILKFLASQVPGVTRCPYRCPEGEERIRQRAVLRPA
jgi:hypothetical protein